MSLLKKKKFLLIVTSAQENLVQQNRFLKEWCFSCNNTMFSFCKCFQQEPSQLSSSCLSTTVIWGKRYPFCRARNWKNRQYDRMTVILCWLADVCSLISTSWLWFLVQLFFYKLGFPSASPWNPNQALHGDCWGHKSCMEMQSLALVQHWVQPIQSLSAKPKATVTPLFEFIL